MARRAPGRRQAGRRSPRVVVTSLDAPTPARRSEALSCARGHGANERKAVHRALAPCAHRGAPLPGAGAPVAARVCGRTSSTMPCGPPPSTSPHAHRPSPRRAACPSAPSPHRSDRIRSASAAICRAPARCTHAGIVSQPGWTRCPSRWGTRLALARGASPVLCGFAQGCRDQASPPQRERRCHRACSLGRWGVHCGTSFPPGLPAVPPAEVRARKNPLLSARPEADPTPGIGRGPVYEISRLGSDC